MKAQKYPWRYPSVVPCFPSAESG